MNKPQDIYLPLHEKLEIIEKIERLEEAFRQLQLPEEVEIGRREDYSCDRVSADLVEQVIADASRVINLEPGIWSHRKDGLGETCTNDWMMAQTIADRVASFSHRGLGEVLEFHPLSVNHNSNPVRYFTNPWIVQSNNAPALFWLHYDCLNVLRMVEYYSDAAIKARMDAWIELEQLYQTREKFRVKKAG